MSLLRAFVTQYRLLFSPAGQNARWMTVIIAAVLLRSLINQFDAAWIRWSKPGWAFVSVFIKRRPGDGWRL
jgi:hypothetical protein